jgi:hypothetical protein
MFKLFGFGISKIGEAPSAGSPALTLPDPDIRLGVMQRELVRGAVRDALQKYAIPGNWLVCDVSPFAKNGPLDTTLILLQLVHWHPELMNFSLVLEQEILKELCRIDTHTKPSNFTFAWRFLPDCGCPIRAMPEPAFWIGPANNPTPEKAAKKAELRKSFESADSDYDHRSSGFAPTQPGGID